MRFTGGEYSAADVSELWQSSLASPISPCALCTCQSLKASSGERKKNTTISLTTWPVLSSSEWPNSCYVSGWRLQTPQTARLPGFFSSWIWSHCVIQALRAWKEGGWTSLFFKLKFKKSSTTSFEVLLKFWRLPWPGWLRTYADRLPHPNKEITSQ